MYVLSMFYVCIMYVMSHNEGITKDNQRQSEGQQLKQPVSPDFSIACNRRRIAGPDPVSAGESR